MRAITLTSVLFAMIGIHTVAQAEPTTLPAMRYELQPGQELTYEGTTELRGSDNSTDTQKEQVWVLGQNDNGTCRLLLRSESRWLDEGDTEPDVTTEVMAFDLSPDGTISNATRSFFTHPSRLFPSLPRGRQEWRDVHPNGDSTTYRLGAPRDGMLVLETRSDGPLRDIYGIRHDFVHLLDPERGLLVSSTVQVEQTHGFQVKGTGDKTLTAVEMRDRAFTDRLRQESEIYFAAREKRAELLTAAATDPARYDEAETVLEAAVTKLTVPMLKEALQQSLEQHREYADSEKEQARKRARIVGQPSPDWELKDLDGNVHRLADYKGKVVILDFWYRNCGWCIRAMPQLNQLAGDFQGRPVAILGINRDRDVEDARFVANEMELKYPTLLGREIPEKYGVTAYPTLLIIDQEGIVRDVHEGWSPQLRQEVGREINALLK